MPVRGEISQARAFAAKTDSPLNGDGFGDCGRGDNIRCTCPRVLIDWVLADVPCGGCSGSRRPNQSFLTRRTPVAIGAPIPLCIDMPTKSRKPYEIASLHGFFETRHVYLLRKEEAVGAIGAAMAEPSTNVEVIRSPEKARLSCTSTFGFHMGGNAVVSRLLIAEKSRAVTAITACRSSAKSATGG